MVAVFIALGSNIDPEKNIRAAAELLRAQWPDIRFSSVYRTKAQEIESQPDFLNAVATFDTDVKPEEVRKKLEVIENKLKKDPPFRFGPRTIDLDLLLFGDLIFDKPDLTIPHPRMHERRFVLEPLCELLDPEGRHPVLKKSWATLLKESRSQLSEQIALHL